MLHNVHMLRTKICWIVLALAVGFPQFAEACPVCFRDPESPMTAGAIAGVGTLLSITGAVLGGFVVLIRRLVRAEREAP
jgi:hypothetical protein